MGKGWLSGLLISIVTMFLLQTIFSYWVQLGLWLGFGVFLIFVIAFLVVIVKWSRGKRNDAERLRFHADLKREQANDLYKKEYDWHLIFACDILLQPLQSELLFIILFVILLVCASRANQQTWNMSLFGSAFFRSSKTQQYCSPSW
jgi:Ca2+/Na+ antiporter